MTVEEAYNYLTSPSYCTIDCDNCNNCCDDCDVNASLNLAVKALEKQIPAKPEERLADMIYNELGEAEYFCSCGVSLICQQNYCDNCGQKLDWSK